MAVTDGLGDLYELLGVRPDASDEEIKRAYRARARELHPDTNHGDPEAEARFKQVTVAYEVLRDPERRARYDRYGPEGVFGAQAGGMGGFNFEGGLGDIFEAFFGQMSGQPNRRRGPSAGADAEVRLDLQFAEAVFGSQKEISVRLPSICTTCAGRGTAPGTEPETCIDCQGTGELRRVRQSLLGQVVTSVACSRCAGTGDMIPHPCPECRGEGRRMEENTFTVEVPAGRRGRVDAAAGRARRGGTARRAERLAVRASRGAPDPRFEREGDNLHTTLTVGLAQAALGVETEIESLDGPQRLLVAPGHPARARRAHPRSRGAAPARPRPRRPLRSTCWSRRRRT